MRVKSEKMAETEIPRYELSPELVGCTCQPVTTLSLYGYLNYLFTLNDCTFCRLLALIILTCMYTAFQQ